MKRHFATCLGLILTAPFLYLLNGCTTKQESSSQNPGVETLDEQEKRVDREIQNFNERKKDLVAKFDSTKFQIIGCKSLYDDNMQSYIQATIINRTNKTVKGIHAYLDDNPKGFLAYRLVIKPHSSAKIKTKYFLCNYRLSGVVLSNGELIDLSNPGEKTESGTVLNSPYDFQEPVLVEDE